MQIIPARRHLKSYPGKISNHEQNFISHDHDVIREIMTYWRRCSINFVKTAPESLQVSVFRDLFEQIGDRSLWLLCTEASVCLPSFLFTDETEHLGTDTNHRKSERSTIITRMGIKEFMIKTLSTWTKSTNQQSRLLYWSRDEIDDHTVWNRERRVVDRKLKRERESW